jgi:hypothetical protein
MNTQPMRLIFVKSDSERQRLSECVKPGNVEKVQKAPVVVIVGQDMAFVDHLPIVFPHNTNARSYYEGKPDLIASTALRNSSLQGGYLILAARLMGLDCGPISGFNPAAVDAQFWAGTSVRSIAELIGVVQRLQAAEGQSPRQRRLDLSPLISDAGLPVGGPQFCTEPRNPPFDKGELAERMVLDTRDAIANGTGGEWHYTVANYNRSIGGRLSGEIARRWGNYGMANAPLVLQLAGSAGQSFGVWNAGGLHMYLEGDANDYVGKGMAAGKLVLRPPRQSGFVARDTVIMGNTCLYGATGGELFAAGRPASALRCATPAHWRWLRVQATTAANT